MTDRGEYCEKGGGSTVNEMDTTEHRVGVGHTWEADCLRKVRNEFTKE